MKSFLITFMIAVAPLLVNGQTQSPDSIPGRLSGILIPDTGYIKISAKQSGAIVTNDRYAGIQPLSAPGSRDEKIQSILNSHHHLFLEQKRNQLKSFAAVAPEQQFYNFLNENGAETQIQDPLVSYKIEKTETDNMGITHIRAVQQYKGIEIYGSESVLHEDNQKERFTGSVYHISQDISETPQIDTIRALNIAQSDLKQFTHFRELTTEEKKLLDYESPDYSLVFYDTGNEKLSLVWIVTLRPNLFEEWKYFINAANGLIIRKYNNTRYDGSQTATGTDLNNMIRTFNVYLSGGIYYMLDITQKMFNQSANEGIIATYDANNTSTLNLDYTYVTSTDNNWTQQAAISAHCNAVKTYQYFNTAFNRNSINGMGGNITSLVNVAEDDGSSMENAFWNGKAVFYGNGGNNFKPLAGALDITAHELSHGVIAATANLEYYGQAGAVNESFADIFACMVDRQNWTIGENVTLQGYSPSGAIRNLADPHNMGDSTKPYWQPAHTSEMYLGSKDNGGIHLNSGICNYAYYLLAAKIGKDLAEQVYYGALLYYLTKTSGFIDLRIAIIQSARDLFGDGSRAVAAAASAFNSVGIYEEEPVNATQVYESNPGEKLLLSYDTKASDPISLYMSTMAGTHYTGVTKTPMKGKVSVTDDGSTVVFVSTDRKIRMLNTDLSNVNERIISGNSSYNNVAISKDGRRVAATKIYSDASIYVIDLVTGQSRQFILYNPTSSSSDVDAGGVLKASSVEFDITGEYLIYDAYNVISSNSLANTYYWDIGIIKVWDRQNLTFGDGTISKLYSSLPANVNVVNPAFSKNSPYIIAFDYFYDDGVIENYSVYGANLETAKISKIASNDRLGYPNFATDDDRIAYSTTNGLNMQVIKSIRVLADKITPSGDAGVLVPEAKWPVYFAKGIRSLGLAPVSFFTTDYKYGNFPLTVRFLNLSLNKPASLLWTFEGGTPDSSREENPQVTFDLPGNYKVTLITQNSFGSDTLIREQYIHVINPTPVNNPEITTLDIYPNPVADMLTIACAGDFFVKIFNLQGGLEVAGANASQLDLHTLKPGMYILELRTNKALYRQKLLKQ